MGNAVAKKYDLSTSHAATAGLCRLYKIYHGTHKETGKEVSVWNLSKDDLLKRDVPIKEKAILEQLYTIMRKDISVMKDPSVDCSGMLKAIEVFDENKQSFSFVTERIICSLADILHRFDGIPGGYHNAAEYLEENGTLSEVEISRGLLNITEALQYMHHIQRKLHASVSPENIVLVPGGQWKLCGFGFALSFSGEDFSTPSPYFMSPLSSSTVIRLEPDLRYCASEMTFGGYNPTSARMVSPAADIFALGATIYEMYTFNLIQAPQGRANVNLIQVANNAVPGHQIALENSVYQLDTSVLPDTMATLLKRLLMNNSTSRANAIEIINHPAFQSGTLAVLRAIDTLGSKDIGTQASQLNTLPGLLMSCPPRLLEGAVLLTISRLCVSLPGLWVYSLPIHVFVAERISTSSYQKVAGPYIKEGLFVQTPQETMQAFLKHMTHIQNQFDLEYFRSNVVGGLIKNSLDTKGPGQLMALHILCDDQVRAKLDTTCLTEDVLPRVCREACKSADIAVKMKALLFMSLVSPVLDEEYLTKNFIPSLKYIIDNDRSSTVTMCVLGVYRSMVTASADSLALSVLPALSPLLAERNLGAQQFEILVSTYYHLSQRLISSRCKELGVAEISPTSQREVTIQELFSSALNVPPALVEKPTGGSGAAKGNGALMLPGANISADSGGSHGGLSLPGSQDGGGFVHPTFEPEPPTYTASLPPPPSYAPTPPPKVRPPGPPDAASLDSFYGEPQQPTMPAPADQTAKSSGSWFGFSSKTKESNSTPPSNVGTLASTPGYKPPVMPQSIAATSQNGGGGGGGGGGADLDMDDFMSSFTKSSAPAPAPAAAPVTAASSSMMFPNNSMGATGSGVGDGNIQEQIRRTQAEIAKLSGGMSGGTPGGMPGGSFPQQQLPYGMQGVQSSGMMQPAMGGPGNLQQQQFGMQPQQQQQYGMQSQQYGGQPGYMQQGMGMGQGQGMGMAMGQQQGMGGYQPPQMSAANAGMFLQPPLNNQGQQQQRPQSNDPFDFLG